MMKDKTMGVSTEVVQAYNQAEDDILNHMKYISEVIILATPCKPNDVDPSAYGDKITSAMKHRNSVSDLRVRGIKIIGAWSAFYITAVTGSTVVKCFSACVGT